MFTRLLLIFLLLCRSVQAEESAADRVKAAIDYWRDTSSESVVEMKIHRPGWERELRLQTQTRGAKESLVRVQRPKKDQGNSTLMINGKMWSFAPKINRVIKIPASMMSQGWLGSDFSNNDIARSDRIVREYVHRQIRSEEHQGQPVYVIESIPKESAPVVWGKEILKIRQDYILLEHSFFDQEGRLVKRLETKKVQNLGGKPTASLQRMTRMEEKGKWTEVKVLSAKYGVPIPDRTFTLSNLRNPR